LSFLIFAIDFDDVEESIEVDLWEAEYELGSSLGGDVTIGGEV